MEYYLPTYNTCSADFPGKASKWRLKPVGILSVKLTQRWSRVSVDALVCLIPPSFSFSSSDCARMARPAVRLEMELHGGQARYITTRIRHAIRVAYRNSCSCSQPTTCSNLLSSQPRCPTLNRVAFLGLIAGPERPRSPGLADPR